MAIDSDWGVAKAQQDLAESRWEQVSLTDPNNNATTYRLRVRDGWLYRVEYSLPGSFQVVMAFVPQESLRDSEF